MNICLAPAVLASERRALVATLCVLLWQAVSTGALLAQGLPVPGVVSTPMPPERIPSAPTVRYLVPAFPTTPRVASPPVAPDVWYVNARLPQGSLQFWRLSAGGWQAASLEEFLAATPPAPPTCFWIHGTRVEEANASAVGLSVHQRITAQARVAHRFVIWSWPSQRVLGPLRDVREKAVLSDQFAYPLAWVVSCMEPSAPVSMIGYSYGGRLASGALHLLGGGQLLGRALPQRPGIQRRPTRAVFIAGSLDNNSLQPGQRNGSALNQLEQLLIVLNANDPVLQWYPVVDEVRGKQAMGASGAAGVWSDRITYMDLSRVVGGSHDLDAYLASPDLMRWIATEALFDSP